ncbi:hypothetical protein KPATCC21470_5753 [Kitasatospora purpeofusca]
MLEGVGSSGSGPFGVPGVETLPRSFRRRAAVPVPGGGSGLRPGHFRSTCLRIRPRPWIDARNIVFTLDSSAMWRE